MLTKKKIFGMVLLVIGILFIATPEQKIELDFNQEFYVTSVNNKKWYLRNGDKRYKLPADAYYGQVVVNKEKEEVYLSNNLGFLSISDKGIETINQDLKAYPNVENKHSVIATPRAFSLGAFTMNKQNYLYSFYNSGIGDGGTTNSYFRLFNADTKKVESSLIKGYVLDAYFDQAKNSIYYLAERGINEGDYFAGKIDLTTELKGEALYDIDIFKDNPQGAIQGIIIPKEDEFLCIACDEETKNIKTYGLKPNGNNVLVDTKKLLADDLYISSYSTQYGDDLFYDQGDYLYKYSLKTGDLKVYNSKGREYLGAFDFKDKYIYYPVDNEIFKLNESKRTKVKTVELDPGEKINGLAM